MRIYVLGSNAFMEEMVKTSQQLRDLGYDGWIHPHYEALVRGEMDDQLKRCANGEEAAVKRENDYLRSHYKHICESDAILIVNNEKNRVRNYIGGNVLIEMGQAYVNNKIIFLLNGIPHDMAYSAEIESMDPVCLHGDLKNIGRTMPQPCNHTSVGMLVQKDGKILLIERMKKPFGFALPAGHVDDGETYDQAAVRELKEEVGLTATVVELVAEGRKENPCRRDGGSWHEWKIYRAFAKGELRRSLDETKRAGWYSKEEIEKLAERTKAYSEGKITAEEWERAPGLEPVMVEWLTEIHLL